jgi:hypothetical protein
MVCSLPEVDMRRTLHGCLVLALAGAGPGCLSSDPTGKSQIELDLDANRMLFTQTPRMSYQFTWQQSCFCTDDTSRRIRITVSGTNLTSAVYVSDQQPVSAAVRDTLKTIPAVFELIHQMIDRHADEISVEYDAALHYPTSVFIDISKSTSDEEIDLHLSDFTTPAG